jgi:hypothetical protein
MFATTRRPFWAILCSALAAGTLLVSGTRAVRADDLLENVRQQNAVLAQELKRAQRDAILDARDLARRDPSGAAALLKRFRVRVEDNKVLTAADREAMLRQLDASIRLYDRSAARVTQQEADRRHAEAVARERAQAGTQQAARQAEQAQAWSRMSQLYRTGNFEEAYKAARDFTNRYGSSPATRGYERNSSFNDALRTVRSIRNERDQRYIRAMREVARSAMPIEGEVEFPADWKEKTKRRSKVQLTEQEKKLIKALNTPITTTIKDRPLQGVLEYLEKTMGIQFEVEKAALDQLMLNYESPVSGKANNISMRGFLKQLFGSINMTYVIREGKIIVTTPDRAAQMLVLKTYYVGDLISLPNFALGPINNQLQLVQNVASLIAFIQSIEPSSWQPTGPGTIFFNPLTMSISVKQTAEMQLMLSGGLGR